MKTTNRSYTSREAAAITGVPYKTIDNWARTSLVVPSVAQAQGSGTERRYSHDDLVALRITRQLRKGGVSFAALRKVVGRLRKQKDLLNPQSQMRLAIIGKDVVTYRECGELVSEIQKPGQGVFVFMVDLKKSVDEVTKREQEFRVA